MSPAPAIDLDAPAAAVFAAIREIDDDGFATLMAATDSRERVIDALVEQLAARLRPERVAGFEAVIHVKLWDRPGGGYDHRELVIRDGACSASDAPAAEPDLTLKVRPEDLRRIVTGRAGAKRLALQGRLRAIGDIRLGLRLGDLFDLSA